MGSVKHSSGSSRHLDPLTHAGMIRAQTELILASTWFQKSKRHTRFLTYLVEKTLSGQSHNIKERSIGVDVFDRSPEYDVANDAIVRVAAAEIKKRLAQYYLNEAQPNELRIELRPGSYVPLFTATGGADAAAPDGDTADAVSHETGLVPPSLIQAAPAPFKVDAPVVAGRPRGGVNFWFWIASLAVLVLGTAIVSYRIRADQPLDEFWAPTLAGHQVTLCIGDLNWIMPDNSDAAAESVDELMARRNHVGQHDVGALTLLANYLGWRQKSAEVYLADNANLSDLRTHPAIFIGAFDNQWTKRILSGFRFHLQFDSADHLQTLVDTRAPGHTTWSISLVQPLSAITRDYAIVARVKSPLNGQTDLIVAGLGPYGTTAASEFVSTPEYFREFSSQAPRGWQNKDIEIVLSTDVIDGHSAPPRVIAVDVR